MATIRTYVINLDRSPQRMASLAPQLAAIGLDYERVSAVDAQQMSPEERALLDQATYERRHGMLPLPGELGCYLSHLKVMRLFLASPAEFAVILEDDVLLTPQLPAAMAGLAACPQRWDMVKLSGIHSGTPQKVLEVAPGQWLSVMLSRCTGSSAYMLNRRAAEVYLAKILPMCLPYDHVFDQGWRLGLKVRLMSPTPCLHDNGAPTTIVSSHGRKRKFPWQRRLPAYGYRIRTELARVAHGLISWASERWTGRGAGA